MRKMALFSFFPIVCVILIFFCSSYSGAGMYVPARLGVASRWRQGAGSVALG